MSQIPQKKLHFLKRYDYFYIFGVGAMTSGIILALYLFFVGQAGGVYARTATFCILAIIQPFIFTDLWLSHRSLIRNTGLILSGIFAVAFLLPFLLQLAIVKVPSLVQIFHVEIISWNDYLLLVMLSSLILPGIWIVKKSAVVFLPDQDTLK